MRLLLADERVDALVVVYVPPLVTTPLEVAAAIGEAAAGATKPILVCLIGGEAVAPARALLRAAHLAVYHFPENAILALGRAVGHARWLRRAPGQPLETSPEAVTLAARWLAPSPAAPSPRWLSPEAVRGVLTAYGIPTPAAEVVANADQAAAAADRMGYPIALKLVSDTITHKSEFGGVALGLTDAAAVRAAAKTITERLHAAGRAAELRGFLVQPMVDASQAVETFVGVTTTRDCGPLIAFGLGGTALEVHRDVVFRINPITAADASDMLEQIRGAPLLGGFRGRPPVDKEALRSILCRTSRLVADFPSIVELDFNPILALPEGQGAVVVDARIRVQ
jgi:acyl-CoA synthetase (NDP forming)